MSSSEEIVLSVLREGGRALTTTEVKERAKKKLLRCPDSTIAFLNRLRMKKKVRGVFSKEKHSWIWWVES